MGVHLFFVFDKCVSVLLESGGLWACTFFFSFWMMHKYVSVLLMLVVMCRCFINSFCDQVTAP